LGEHSYRDRPLLAQKATTGVDAGGQRLKFYLLGHI
jgi:hypothetical protein